MMLIVLSVVPRQKLFPVYSSNVSMASHASVKFCCGCNWDSPAEQLQASGNAYTGAQDLANSDGPWCWLALRLPCTMSDW